MTKCHPTTITTERLELRPPRVDDASAVAALMTPEVSRWLASWPSEVDHANAVARITEAQAEVQTGRAFHWLIAHREGSRVLGWVRITRSDTDPARGELGFWLGTAFQGVGYATEAVRAAVSAGFEGLGLAVIEGGAQPPNEGSQRVMRRVGMVPSGERQVWASARQRYELCVYFEIDRSQVAGHVVSQSR